ncbi:MAG: hypothetical protein PHO37_15700 [Kiritimatiellae bacterium]|nr:hypothetical protein [Kiritimatiellia bacterium]
MSLFLTELLLRGRICVACTLVAAFGSAHAAAPVNLALKAKASANSEYNANLAASFVNDGKVPARLCRNDNQRAWAVPGETHRQGAELTLTWEQPVQIKELVYFGRTAFEIAECWKECEVYFDSDPQPAQSVTFEQRHGAQRITLPEPRMAGRVTLRFKSSYGGSNPGASEVMVYAAELSDNELRVLQRPFYENPLADSELSKTAYDNLK